MLISAQTMLPHMKRPRKADLLKELIANLDAEAVVQEGAQQLAIVLKRCQRVVLQ